MACEFDIHSVGEHDRAELARWIAADPDHRGRVTPDFFIGGNPRDAHTQTLKFTDQAGAVFYVRLERVLRVHIQFGPNATPAGRARTGAVLRRGFAWLIRAAEKAGFREVLFQSTVAPLRNFACKRLGFRKSADELVCGIGPSGTQVSQENPARAEHHTL